MAPPRRPNHTEDMEPPNRRGPFLILPSLAWPFNRRGSRGTTTSSFSPTSSTDTTPSTSPTTATTTTTTTTTTTGTIHRARPDCLRCRHCSTEFAYASQIVSKGFTGRLGRAYLVAPPQSSHVRSRCNNLFNIQVGKVEGRALVTGWHEVADISCRGCGETVGWKYVDAKDESQKYKIGKFILETAQAIRHSSFEDTDVVAVDQPPPNWAGAGSPCPENDWTQRIGDTGTSVAAVEFDSEDEDECDEIFAGIWDPTVAAKRRSRRQRKIS